MTSLETSRPPLAEKAIAEMEPLPDVAPRADREVLMPGVRATSCKMLRPFSGSASVLLPLTASASVELAVSSSGACDFTSTTSVTAPSSSATSRAATCATSSVRPVRSCFLNPFASTESE